MSFDSSKLINSISKIKTRTKIMKLTPEELLFLSEIFYDFTKSKFPVPDFYVQRLQEYNPIIVKFGRCRTFKSARKLSHHVPLNVFASICRWRLNYDLITPPKSVKKLTKKERQMASKKLPTSEKTVDIKPSVIPPVIYLSFPSSNNALEASSIPQTSNNLQSNTIKQEVVSSFTEISDNNGQHQQFL
jgi:hypothetical protein